ncbi:MAG: Ig-like domain-containing protein [bacterium]
MKPARSLAALVTVLCGLSCGGADTLAPVPAPASADVTPSSLTATSPTTALGVVGSALATSLAVKVVNKAGNPLGGAAVVFHVDAGGGAVSSATAITDAKGAATTIWTLGPTVGEQRVSATIGTVTPVVFTAVASSAASAAITKGAGDGQTSTVGSAVTTPPDVKVLDAFGNPVGGVPVAFSVSSGGGSLTAATVTTTADGVARVGKWTLGTKPGPNTLQVSAGGNLVTSFSAIAVTGPASSVQVTSAGAAERRMGDQVKVTAKVFDAFGNPLADPPVAFSVQPAGIGSIVQSGSVSTVSTVTAGRLTVTGTSGAATGKFSIDIIGRPTSMTVSTTIQTPGAPTDVAVTNDGLYVAARDPDPSQNQPAVIRYSADGTMQVAVIPIPTVAPSILVVAPAVSGKTAIVVNTGSISSSYWFLDLNTNTVVDTFTTGRYVQNARMSDDGTRAYFLLDAGELAVIDVATHHFVKSITLGDGVVSIRYAHGDSLAYAYSTAGVLLEIDLKAAVVRRQIRTSIPITQFDITRDGSLIYSFNPTSGELRIMQVSDLSTVYTVLAQGSTVSISPDGGAIYLASTGVRVMSGDVNSGIRDAGAIATTDAVARVIFNSTGSMAVVQGLNGAVDIIR